LPFGALAGETVSAILMGEVTVEWSVDESLAYWCNERKIPVRPWPSPQTHKSFNDDDFQPQFYVGAFIPWDFVMGTIGIVRMLQQQDMGCRIL
jgi:hypothetical protein